MIDIDDFKSINDTSGHIEVTDASSGSPGSWSVTFAIVLSAHPDARRVASELGVTRWLKKPVDMTELVAVVGKAYA